MDRFGPVSDRLRGEAPAGRPAAGGAEV